jgi:methylated-DNA-[protein]-cysteine S-methyltransferase
MLYKSAFIAPIGTLGLLANEEKLLKLSFNGLNDITDDAKEDNSRFKSIFRELEEYFAGEREQFSVDYLVDTSPFAAKVYKEMVRIPYGTTLSYSELARKSGRKLAYRAVGTACGKNPLPLIIPCHRVTAVNGLGGFGGGLDTKRFLLNLETN